MAVYFFTPKTEHMFPFGQSQNNIDERRLLQKQRLHHRVQLQSRQIERVLNTYHVPAHVSGGVVSPQLIQFDLQTQLYHGFERLKELTVDLRQALGVPQISIHRDRGRLQIAVARAVDAPVRLLDVLAMKGKMAPLTAVIGLSESGQPLTLPFQENHMFITGIDGAGKTSMLRSIATSLALAHRQSQVQEVIIAPLLDNRNSISDLEPLTALPHLSAQIAYQLSDSYQHLLWLVEEMENRLQWGEGSPAIVVMVDQVVDLVELEEQPFSDLIASLLQRGKEAGIHLVLTTRRPDSEFLDTHMMSNLPVRIVGKALDAAQAAVAAGIEHSEAEYLLGQGDFLYVADGIPTYFQSAYIDDYDLHMSIKKLHRNYKYSILAKPFSIRPRLPDVNPDVIPDSFWLRNDEIDFNREEN